MYPMRRIDRMGYLAADAHSELMSGAVSRPRHWLASRACPLAMLCSDLAAFAIAVFWAFAAVVATRPPPFARAIGNVQQLGAAWHGWGTFLVLACLLGYFMARGHYTSRVPFWTQFGDVVMGCAIALAADTFVTIALYGRPVDVEVLLRWVLFCPSLMLMRACVRELLTVAGLWSINTLVIAEPGAFAQARAALLSDRALGYQLVGAIELEAATALGDDDLLELIKERGAEFVVVGVGTGNIAAERNLIIALRRARLPMALIPALEGLPVVGLRQHHFFSHDVVMLVSHNNLARPFSRIVKGAFDQVVAVVLLVLLAPLLVALAILVRTDGGPAFYRHRRIGAGGRSFDCIKFRTMVVESDAALRRVLEADPAAREEWLNTQKLRNDPRVTRWGRFLRRSSLDELPQLLNVLRGEMSLVGPRPIVQAEIARYADDIDYYYETKPGLTGLWQVSGRSDTSYARRVRLDVWYVRNWTLWHDIAILLKTIPAVFLQRGAQ